MAIELSDQAAAAFDDIRNNPDTTQYCPEVVACLDNLTTGDRLNFRVEAVQTTRPSRNHQRATLVVLRPLEGEVSMDDLAATLGTNGALTIISQSADQLEFVYECYPLYADGSSGDDSSSS